jgi:hypothetical protein
MLEYESDSSLVDADTDTSRLQRAHFMNAMIAGTQLLQVHMVRTNVGYLSLADSTSEVQAYDICGMLRAAVR